MLVLPLACGCAAAPPPPPPPLVSAPASASASASAPPSAPVPVVELRWKIEDDFVHSAVERVEPRAFDAALVAGQLPAGQRRLFSELAHVEKGKNTAPEARAPEAAELISKLEASARGKNPRAAAAWLAAAWLTERWRPAPKKGDEGWQPRATRSYASAVAGAPVSEPIGALARYQQAIFLHRLSRDDRGKSALQALLDGPAELQPEAIARLGLVLLTGPGASPEQAAEMFRRGLQSRAPMSVGLRGALVHGLMLASYRQSQHSAALEEALDFLRGFRSTGAPSIPVEGALRVGADSLEQGALEAALARPTAPELSEVLLRAAWRSVRREDFPTAERVASQVLAAAPMDWQAPNALRILIASAEGAGQLVVAEERRARLIRDFGVTSPWAEAQRAGRASDGWPSDTVIAAASKPPPRPPPEAPAARAENRARALVRLCVEPHLWRLPAEASVAVTLDVDVSPDGVAKVSSALRPADAPLEGVRRCIERLGPAHFQKSPASVRAVAEWPP